jgi:DNA-binding transcriptional MerR regulator
MTRDIPDKLYFKIGEVSKLANVAPHVIRYWETEFSEISPKRANSNQRLYRRVDVELILKIKTLLHGRGYTISGARKYLQTVHETGEIPQIVSANTAIKRLGKIKADLLQLYEILDQKK